MEQEGEGGNDGAVVCVNSFQQLKGSMRDFEKGPLPEDFAETLNRAQLVTKATALSYYR